MRKRPISSRVPALARSLILIMVTGMPAIGQEPAAVSSDPAAAVPEAAAPTPDPCLMGGYKPGTVLTDEEYKRIAKLNGRPKLYKADHGGTIVQVPTPGFMQFVEVRARTVVAVVREFEGETANKVRAALAEKYGDPVSGDLYPHVRSGYNPLFGSIKLEQRSLFRDSICGYDVEYVEQQKTTITAVGGGSGMRVAVVVTKGTAAGQPNDLLK